jgi:hypothetical protein
VAEVRSTDFRPKDHYQLCSSICQKTPFYSAKPGAKRKICDKNIGANDQRNIHTIRSRDCRRIVGQDRISVKIVSDTQAEWQNPANFRPSTTKFLYKFKKVSLDKPELRSQISSTKRLHGKDRHLAGLLSHPDKRESPALPRFLLRETAFPNDFPTIRPFKRTFSLFQSEQMDSKRAKSAEHPRIGLSRRFLIRSPGPTSIGVSGATSDFTPPKSGLGLKPREVDRKSRLGDRISRHNMEHCHEQAESVGVEMRPISKRYPETYRSGLLELESGNVANRQIRFCRSSNPFRTITHKRPTESISYPTRRRPREEVYIANVGQGRFTLVGEKPGTARKNLHTRTKDIYYHRRLKYRLGSSVRQPSPLPTMDRGTTRVAHKSKGIVCGPNGTDQVFGGSEGPICNGAIGQQNGRSIYKKSGWDEISDAFGGDKRITRVSPSSQCYSHPVLYPRPVQCSGRLSLTREETSRLAPQQTDYDDNISKDGCAPSGSFRIKSLQGGLKVCDYRCEGYSGRVCERIQQGVALPTSMDLPSSTSNPEGSSAPEQGVGNILIGGTTMGERVLERRPEEEVSGSTVSHLESGTTSNRSFDQSTSTGREGPIFGSLEGTGWGRLTAELQSDDIALLRSAWRDSTWKTYSSSWKQWISWCKRYGARPDVPRPQEVAAYLSFLFRIKKLAYATILVHKSVIVTLSDPERGKSLSSHPLIATMLKAINLQRQASVVVKPQIWNILDLLHWLRSHPPDKHSIFQVSRYVALLLLVASGRRIHDLTLLSIHTDHYIVTESSITFWPIFGSKTDGKGGRQSGWLLRMSNDTAFDLVSWIKCLIVVTEGRRNSLDNLGNLFITTRGTVRAASRSIIAGWLKTAFKEIGINCTPGSIRSAVASYDYVGDTPLDEILKRGNWRGSTNFFKHYCKAVERPRAGFTGNSLRNSFEAV